MNLKNKIGTVVAAALLAVLAGTSAYAISGGAADPGGEGAWSAFPVAEDAADGAAGASTLAMCVEGAEDCVDMVVTDDARCAADVGCDTFVDCGDPAVSCVAPLPYPGCISYGEGVTILPLPVERGEGSDGLPAPIDDEVVIPPMPEDYPVGGEVVDPPIGVEVCPPVDTCTEPAPADGAESLARCLPPDCSVSSDGSVACPEPAPCPEDVCGVPPTCVEPDAPAVEGTVEKCLPPECIASSDGSVACPEPLPCPAEGCSDPGPCCSDPGFVPGDEPIDCNDPAIACSDTEECVKLPDGYIECTDSAPARGGGSGAAEGGGATDLPLEDPAE